MTNHLGCFSRREIGGLGVVNNRSPERAKLLPGQYRGVMARDRNRREQPCAASTRWPVDPSQDIEFYSNL
nr:hypothetical protein [uncultured Roseovarius sp.]